MPNIDAKEIFKRAVHQKPPFQKKTDKGCKDTFIWLSIIEHLSTLGSHSCIFCTGDTIFDAARLIEEFESVSISYIKILEDPSQVKEFLALEFNLEKEQWINTVNAIKNKVRENIGLVIEQLHSLDYYISDWLIDKYKVVSFRLIDVDFLHVLPGMVEYDIEVMLTLEATYDKSQEMNDYLLPQHSGYEKPCGSYLSALPSMRFNKTKVTVKVKLTLNNLNDKFEIVKLTSYSGMGQKYGVLVI